jgi:hypothetical protein
VTTTINLDLLNKARLRHKHFDNLNANTDGSIVNFTSAANEDFKNTAPTIKPLESNKQSVIDAAEVKKEELRQEAEIKALQDEINNNNEEEKEKLLKTQAKIAEAQGVLEEKKAQTQKVDGQRKAKEAAIQREISKKEQISLDKKNIASIEHKKQLQQLDEQKKEASKAHVWKWIKMMLITLFSLVVLGFLFVGLFLFYRWVTEVPMTIEVEKIVEKIVVKESEVAVIAPNCLKLTQDGETHFNCAGITYQVNTLGELNKEQIAEIKSAMDKKGS